MHANGALSVDILNDNSFAITGATELLLENPRAKIALRRLDYKLIDGKIVIEYIPETKISTLDSLRQLADKFNLELNLEESVKSRLKNPQKFKAER